MEIIKGRGDIITAKIIQSGVAFDLTGYSSKLVISAGPGMEQVLNKAGVNSIAEVGSIDFTLASGDLISANAGHYKYEVNIWKTSTPSILYTPIRGSIQILNGLVEAPAG